MTDDIKAKVAETVARLRRCPEYYLEVNVDHDAADLLEALASRLAEVEAERDALMEAVQANMLRPDYLRAEAAEARLAKAVDALRDAKLIMKLGVEDIEELEREQARLHTQCDGLMQAAMNNGQALILAEARLAKAVGALRECQEALRDHMKQYPHMAKGYTVDAEKNARATLAEIEGEKIHG